MNRSINLVYPCFWRYIETRIKILLKVLKNIILIGLLAFLAVWALGIIEINGATFNIVDVKATTYWDYDEEDGDPFPIVPVRSKQVYEDALVGFKPDFEEMLNAYVNGETVIGLSTIFSDGKVISSEGTDYNFCLYPENLSITKTKMKSFHHKYVLADSNIFEFEYNVPYYGRHRYFQTHSVDFNLEVDVNGIYSSAYIDYKLKEIYLYYMLDALRQHVHAEKPFLEVPYLDTLDNLMFVRDNFEVDKEEFLGLDPAQFSQLDFLPSRASMDYYTDDEDCVGVLIGTSR